MREYANVVPLCARDVAMCFPTLALSARSSRRPASRRHGVLRATYAAAAAAEAAPLRAPVVTTLSHADDTVDNGGSGATHAALPMLRLPVTPTETSPAIPLAVPTAAAPLPARSSDDPAAGIPAVPASAPPPFSPTLSPQSPTPQLTPSAETVVALLSPSPGLATTEATPPLQLQQQPQPPSQPQQQQPAPPQPAPPPRLARLVAPAPAGSGGGDIASSGGCGNVHAVPTAMPSPRPPAPLRRMETIVLIDAFAAAVAERVASERRASLWPGSPAQPTPTPNTATAAITAATAATATIIKPNPSSPTSSTDIAATPASRECREGGTAVAAADGPPLLQVPPAPTAASGRTPSPTPSSASGERSLTASASFLSLVDPSAVVAAAVAAAAEAAAAAAGTHHRRHVAVAQAWDARGGTTGGAGSTQPGGGLAGKRRPAPLSAVVLTTPRAREPPSSPCSAAAAPPPVLGRSGSSGTILTPLGSGGSSEGSEAACSPRASSSRGHTRGLYRHAWKRLFF